VLLGKGHRLVDVDRCQENQFADPRIRLPDAREVQPSEQAGLASGYDRSECPEGARSASPAVGNRRRAAADADGIRIHALANPCGWVRMQIDQARDHQCAGG